MLKLHNIVILLVAVLGLGIYAHLTSHQTIACATCTTAKCERKFPKRFLHSSSELSPSVCVIGRSSVSHLPTALSGFSFSLLSQRSYPSVIQFIIGCGFNTSQEAVLRSVVERINCVSNVTAVFVVNRNETNRTPYIIEGLNDFCYIETDLLIDRLLLARTGDLQDGQLAWPALALDYLPQHPESPLCDYFLFSNTDNLYGSLMLEELSTFIIVNRSVSDVLNYIFIL